MSIISSILISLLICAVSAVLEGLFAGSETRSFIGKLRAPSYAPPFGVWITIGVGYYIICFLISFRILRHQGDQHIRIISLTLLLAMMAANAFWNYVFFRRQNLFLSFFAFIPYPLIAVALFFVLRKFESIAAWFFLPYLIYLSYATLLCYKYWKLNPNRN